MGYDVKGVPPGRAEVVTCSGNFHGRTISIVGFSSDPDAYTGFGPYPAGFVSVEYGNADAFESAITDDTVAVLLEPIQGRRASSCPGGLPRGGARGVHASRRPHDRGRDPERTRPDGETFACDHENVTPDIYVLGKALGGGLVPVSAVVADWPVMRVIGPGQHGSTFGGNPSRALWAVPWWRC